MVNAAMKLKEFLGGKAMTKDEREDSNE